MLATLETFMITFRTLCIVIFFALICVIVSTYAASPLSSDDSDIDRVFPGLKSVSAPNAGVTIFYAPSLTTILSGEAATIKIWDGEDTADRPIRTQLLGAGKGYFTVQCDAGPSGDPNCQFIQDLPSGDTRDVPIKPADSKNSRLALFGLRFILPGNGIIYVDGHMDTTFNERHKFEWKDGVFVEVKQPFLYVGLDSTTITSVILYTERDYQHPVAQLPANSPVKVLLNVSGTDDYLLRTPFGIVGWTKIPPGGQTAEGEPIATVINGIYFRGD
jgi:hypothetical protein